ncbi:uncharacterized protein LOC128553392, partial [Mercenaria mercenaria]|uniref:uncharacterized protein LOC128553392 n=1 Tax=Mercenaria mercenaria TaxID=6596 RepID=UPI00234F4571
MPEGSYIILKTTDDLNTELIFKKDFRWTEQLHGFKFSFSNNKAAVPHSLLRKIVGSSLVWNETADMDTQLFLLLNDISHFDDEEKAGEALMIVNTFVVFTGKMQPQNVFTDLASDEQHVYGPITGNTNDNIFRYETEHFLDLSCQNSRSNCGTSMYLNRSRCYKCGYICGRTKNTSPQFCLSACSNFDQYTSTGTLSLVDMSKNSHNSCTDPLLYQVAIAILVVLLVCVTCKYCLAGNEKRKKKSLRSDSVEITDLEDTNSKDITFKK